MHKAIGRRDAIQSLMGAGIGLVAAPAIGQEISERPEVTAQAVERNIPSFRLQSWQNHFDNLAHGAILCDTVSRALQF